MISHGKEIKVFTGNSNPELAHNICAQLYQNLGSSTVSQFADGECSISVFEPVRGVSTETSSMSQPLQEPALIWNSHGDFAVLSAISFLNIYAPPYRPYHARTRLISASPVTTVQ